MQWMDWPSSRLARLAPAELSVGGALGVAADNVVGDRVWLLPFISLPLPSAPQVCKHAVLKREETYEVAEQHERSPKGCTLTHCKKGGRHVVHVALAREGLNHRDSLQVLKRS